MSKKIKIAQHEATKQVEDDNDRGIAFDLLQAAGTMMVVRLDQLNIDQASYQRDERPHHAKIAKEFDPRACPPLTIGRRPDGTLWLIDGQQRRAALLKMGIKEWNAIVFHSDGPESEARIFAICGGGKGTVKKLLEYELVRALLTARDPLTLSCKNAIERSGLKWKLSSGKVNYPYIGMHRTILRLTKRYGEDVIARALTLVNRTWSNQDMGTRTEVVYPVVVLIGVNGLAINDDRFVKLLSALSPMRIVTASRSVTTAGWRYQEAYSLIVRRYNLKLTTNKLPESMDGNPLKEEQRKELSGKDEIA